MVEICPLCVLNETNLVVLSLSLPVIVMGLTLTTS